MKLLRIIPLLLTASTISASLFSSNVLDSWDESDLKEYLKDNSIPFDEKKATIQQIKELSNKQYQLKKNSASDGSSNWYHPVNLKQQVLGFYEGAFGKTKPATFAESYANAKDWIFSTWSTEELKKLLKKANVTFNPNSTRSELIKTAQSSYDDIAKHFNVTGKYTGDWIFSDWDEKSLKKWLKDYGVDYSNLKDNKKELVHKVRENACKASKYSEDQLDSVLESLDLANQSLFDKAGSIKDDIFNTWTSSQLYNWLVHHKVDVAESYKNNKEELALLAQKHKDDFKSDVDSWIGKASKKASPLLSKSSEKVDNLVNDTFFVGIEKWSRDRLKAFLDSRGVSIPYFATKHELIELVKENKYKPVTNFNGDYFFKGWSKENVAKYIGDIGSDISSTSSSDILNKANDLYKSFVDNVSFYSSKLSNAVDGATAQVTQKSVDAKDAFFDYWSDVELRNYLNTFGIYNTNNYRREDLLKLVKENTRWFVSGSKYDTSANSFSSNVKYHSANFWNDIASFWTKVYNYVYYTIF